MIEACVIGWPITHSRSPLIHGHWLARHHIDGNYTKRAVRPEEAHEFLRTLGAHGLAGCNVTLPHKEVAYAAADVQRPAARAMRAANTLWFENGKLVADSTDGTGFMGHLRETVPGFAPAGQAVSVLGAGGSARALVFAFLEAGVGEIRLFNRTRDRAEAVARHFGEKVKVHEWSERADRSRGTGLLVNTTSLGMRGMPALEMDLAGLDDACIVADIVYVPLVTPLLAAARARGMTTVDGLGMLMHQAVPGFERWFGVRPRVDGELRALLVADIEAR
jgi:shikimate dehydrogenase